ncbi:helicase C-terminal domain-containing protein [Natrinema sp. HArc-T2]|uniref:helicase C-terminal domain-containing protein n=1 Tax=Natrinema sp. HArc-T2 TaxID=3242701 RepID=UPI00359E2BB5
MPSANFIPDSPSEKTVEDLGCLHPQTDDAEYLNAISERQLHDFTYRVNEDITNVGNGNILVPSDVAEIDSEEYATQHFPAGQSVTFFVEADNLSDATATVILQGFQAATVSAESDRHQFRDIPRNVPPEFFDVTVGSEQLTINSRGRPDVTSAPPIGFEYTEESINLEPVDDETFTETITVPGESTLAQTTEGGSAGSVTSAELNRNGTPRNSITPSDDTVAEIAYERQDLQLELEVQVRDTPDREFKRITFEYRNETSVPDDPYLFQKYQNHVYYPTMDIRFDGLEANVIPQQHATSLAEELGETDDSSSPAGLSSPSLPQEGYVQRNCVLTRCTQENDDEHYLTTAYGIMDFIEQQPIPEDSVAIDLLVESTETLKSELRTTLSDEELERAEEEGLVELLRGVLRAVPDGLDLPGDQPKLYSWQWEVIKRRVKYLSNDEDKALIMNVHTSGGKTLAYFVSAALVTLHKDTRAILPFPTRVLNDDMIERVIGFMYHLRQQPEIDEDDCSCGICIGKGSHNDYDIRKYLQVSDMDAYIPKCHQCGGNVDDVHECVGCGGTSVNTWTQSNGWRGSECNTCESNSAFHFLACDDCGYEYRWVHDVAGTSQYLPRFTVGTPDKFVHMATLQTHSDHSTYSRLPFFGAPYVECESCGRALTEINSYRRYNRGTPFGREPHELDIDPESLGGIHCSKCDHRTEANWEYSQEQRDGAKHDPIGHIVLDETHMYTGYFGTGISIALSLFKAIASRFKYPTDHENITHSISVDAGTATSSNQQEHLTTLLRDADTAIVPEPGDEGDYFEPLPDRARYRVLGLMPASSTTLGSFRQSMVRTHQALEYDTAFETELTGRISRSSVDTEYEDYTLLLGYLYKKSIGNNLQMSIRDLTESLLDRPFQPRFLSGESSKADLQEAMRDARSGDLSMLLANLVISLGIDIDKLNNMILFGAPRSTSEQMQTIGRTGRREGAGHATIHLFPTRSRDTHLYRKWHSMMSNIGEYYKESIIQPTNPFVADRMFDTVLSPFVTSLLAAENRQHRMDDLVELTDCGNDTIRDVGEEHAIPQLLKDVWTVMIPDDDVYSGPTAEKVRRLIKSETLKQMGTYVNQNGTDGEWQHYVNEAEDSTDEQAMNPNVWFSDRADLNLRHSESGGVTTTLVSRTEE